MKLLFIDCCIRGERESRTLALCKHFLDQLEKLHPDIELETISLLENRYMPLTQETLRYRDEQIGKGAWENEIFKAAHTFANADYIVIGAPYWDLSFLAALKAYLEHICVCGITFCYENDACKGLCRAKKLMYISTIGGYVNGTHLGADYVEAVCDMVGIPEMNQYHTQGLDIVGIDADEKIGHAKEEITELASDWIEEI